MASSPIRISLEELQVSDTGGHAIDLEAVAAVADAHAQSAFDLAQVLVKLTAQAGQPAAIVGFERQMRRIMQRTQGRREGWLAVIRSPLA